MLLDVVNEITSLDSVRKCVDHPYVIDERSKALLMSVREEEIPYDHIAYAN